MQFKEIVLANCVKVNLIGEPKGFEKKILCCNIHYYDVFFIFEPFIFVCLLLC